MVRIGLLGASGIAPWALVEPLLRRGGGATLQAVAARDPARAADYALAHRIPHVAADYAALVARDDVDLVYVALPAALHARWSIAALEAGKAVLCEKPLAPTAGEVAAMYDAARRARRPLWEAMHYRHHRTVREAIAACRAGALGELLEVQADFEAQIAPRDGEIRWQAALGGGATLDLGCYCVHALRTLLGDALALDEVRAGWQQGVDARLQARLRSAGGVAARLSCSMVDAEFASRLAVRGERGTMVFDGFVSPHWQARLVWTIDGVPREQPVDPRPSFDWQLDHVLARCSAEPDPADEADSRGNVALIERLLAAAR